MNFDECTKRLQELYNEIFNDENSKNENYKILEIEFNEVFINLLNSSINEKRCFSGSPLNLFKIELLEWLKLEENKKIDFDENEYLKSAFLYFCRLLGSNRNEIRNGDYYYISQLNDEHYKLFCSILKKRIEYFEKLLFTKGIEVITHRPYPNDYRINYEFKKHINIMVENDNLQPIKTTTKPKTNKSLMFEGTNLNIKDRYRILNKVLDFDKKVHPLNIGELEKYQLLAYILGIDKDNARKLMCGSHDAKDNDLTPYFNDLGLNK